MYGGLDTLQRGKPQKRSLGSDIYVTIATAVDKSEVYNLYGKSIEKSIYNAMRARCYRGRKSMSWHHTLILVLMGDSINRLPI